MLARLPLARRSVGAERAGGEHRCARAVHRRPDGAARRDAGRCASSTPAGDRPHPPGPEQAFWSTRARAYRAIKADQLVTPAGEAVDNFYLIEEQVCTARRPPRICGPSCLRTGSSAGCRAHDIALEIIAHGDGQVDPESLSRFIAAYQMVTPLTGRLWAIPIMLRLALIENLRRAACRAAGRQQRRRVLGGPDDAHRRARSKTSCS
jgi:hypothetical protein